MNIFLTELSKIVLDKYTGKELNAAIIVPNKRAKLFLKPLISKSIDQPIWSPQFMTIDEFVFETTKLKKANNTMLSFEIYQAYLKVEALEKIAFSKFLEMANDLLSDINEIDNQMINAKDIFTYLHDCKEIDEWKIDRDNLTKTQSSYIKFYESIYTIYINLRHSLLEKQTAYYGLAARQLAENNGCGVCFDKVLFAGLNALSKAENIFINHIVKSGKGEIVWDAEAYFMDDSNQEAGTFLRKQFDSNSNILFDSISKIENIEIIGTAQNIYQAKIAGNIIKKQYSNEDNLSNSAVVLFDENLLIPLLNSIPQEVNKYNITMGYPIKHSPLYSLFEIILTIRLNYVYFNQDIKDELINTKDIINLLTNPYFSKIIDRKSSYDFINNLKEQNTMFIDRAQLSKLFADNKELFNHLGNFVFSKQDDIITINRSLIILFEEIRNRIDIDNSIDINLEFFSIFNTILIDMEKIITQYPAIGLDFKTYIKILQSNISSGNISFYGEPLTGLQIMGVLETRTLDFDNLILLSANEGFIPQNIKPSTFIPADIKRHFHIPSIQDKTSIYAYYFYRLVLKAKNIHILYSTEQSGLGSNDKSRYILQILNELKPKIGNAKVTERIETPIHSERIEPIKEIVKNEVIISKIKQVASKGFSASTLNSYQNCSLQYYFQHILKMNSDDEITGVLENDVMGTVIHDSLETLYKPFIDTNIITPAIRKNISDTLTAKLKKHFNNSNINYGKNLLIKEVMLNFINNFVEFETNQLKDGNTIIIKHLEEELSTTLVIDGIDSKVQVKGFADRIDMFNDVVRIIDYKTGKVLPSELSITSIEELMSKPKAFQVLFYAYLYSKKNNMSNTYLSSGIYSMRHLNSGFIEFSYNNDSIISSKILREFEIYLYEIIQDIFNPSIPFQQTADATHCQYCSYKAICNM